MNEIEVTNAAALKPAGESPPVVFLTRLAVGSRRAMLQGLERAARLLTGDVHGWDTCPWSTMRYTHLQALRSILQDEGLAPASCNKIMSAVKGCLQECWKLGLITHEEYERASHVESIRGERLPAGRHVAREDIVAIFAALSRDPRYRIASRDAAMIAVLYACGLRRQELVDLSLSDYDQEHGSLLVHGKRSKDRLVYVAGGTKSALDAWVTTRGSREGPLFCRLTTGHVHTSLQREIAPLSTTAVYLILRERADAAGVPAFSPHSLRRTCVGELLTAGADLSAVSALLGHSNVQTTARYDRRGEMAKMAAAALIEAPVA